MSLKPLQSINSPDFPTIGEKIELGRLFNKGIHVLLGYWYLRDCTSIGRLPRAYGKPAIHNFGEIIVGDKLNLQSRITRSQFVAYEGARLEIGNQVFINYGASISAHKLVSIGDRCKIGPYAYIMDNDYHSIDDFEQLGESKPVILGTNVWLAVRVTILKGVTIGNNSVIGAGSVVTHDIPANCLAAGAPAKVIKSLSPQDHA